MIVSIRTDNAAFRPNPQYELARIFRELANKLENGQSVSKLYDTNGNLVGNIKGK
jgi:hypothetical protein